MSPNSLNFMHFGITIVLLLFFSTMSFSNGDTDKEYYNVCSSLYSCGHIKGIGYPFWGDGRPEYCGLPEFKLECGNNKSVDFPHIWTIRGLRGNYFKVRRIDTSNSTIFVARDKNESFCRALVKPDDRPMTNVNGPTPFRLGKGVANLGLFYDCPSNGSHLGLFPCSSIDANASVLYYLDQPAQVGTKLCKSTNVTIPVSKRALDEFVGHRNSRILESVLEEEFEVQYTISNFSDCLGCHNSGGVCGSSVNYPFGFVCYRPGYRPDNSDLGGILLLGLGITGGAIFIIALVGVAVCLRKRTTVEFSVPWKGKATKDHQNIEACLRLQGSLAPRRYTYANIRKMTNSFKEKLGEGGYAVVYKGELSDGRLVAVKLLKQSKCTNKGEEFINEVASMGRTNHVNIVTLLGFCFDRNRRALVFEFMPNGSLDKFTHHNSCHQSLTWKTIFDIAIGIARGLEYLHRGCNTRILHFDIKPHNILLDEDLHPKISDFGLARLCPTKETTTISMLEARGTIGYIAPEVFCRNFGGVSHKSDVYSYGMMVLDLVCGRKNNTTCVGGIGVEGDSGLSFGEWIYQRIELGDEIDGGHASMSDEEKELRRKMIMVSLWCIQTYPSNRPSISKVVEMLEGCIELISVPPKPFLCSPPRITFGSSTSPNDSTTLE